MNILGWVVWGAVALYTAVLWGSAIRNGNGGVRFLSSICALFFTAALLFVWILGIPKFHLLWAAIVVYVVAMTAGSQVIESRVKSAPTRAEEESKRTGEPAADILRRELDRLGYGPEDGAETVV
jgi:hypothetical protein